MTIPHWKVRELVNNINYLVSFTELANDYFSTNGDRPSIEAMNKNLDKLKAWNKLNPQEQSDEVKYKEISDGYSEIIQLLAGKALSKHDRTFFGSTPLMIAAMKGHLEMVKRLVKDKTRPLNFCNQEGESALSLALRRTSTHTRNNTNHLEVALILLNAGAVPQPVPPIYQPKDTPLSVILEEGNVGMLRLCLQIAKEEQNMKGHELNVLLIRAVELNDPAKVGLLLSFGANPNVVDKDGNSLLHYAALHGYSKVAEIVLHHPRCNIVALDKNGKTALEIANIHGHRNIAALIEYNKNKQIYSLAYLAKECLIQLKASSIVYEQWCRKIEFHFGKEIADQFKLQFEMSNFPHVQQIQQTLPHEQAQAYHTELVTTFEKNVTDLIHFIEYDKNDGTFFTPQSSGDEYQAELLRLHNYVDQLKKWHALPKNDKEYQLSQARNIYKATMNLLASNTLTGTEVGSSPLLVAAYYHNMTMMQTLVKHGAELNYISTMGESILTTLLREHAQGLSTSDEDLQAMVEFLLQAGAHLNPDSHQYEPLRQPLTLIMSKFKKDKDYKLFKLCLSKGADLEATDYDGETALYTAVMMKDPALVKILLKAGANPNTIVSDETTLHCAVKLISDVSTRHKIVKLIVKNPLTDFYIEDSEGKTALDLATENELPQIARMIQRAMDARLSPDAANIRDLIQFIEDDKNDDAGFFTPENSGDEYQAELLRLHAHVAQLKNWDALPINDKKNQLSQALDIYNATMTLLASNTLTGTDRGSSPLLAAAFFHNMPMMQILVKHGADLNYIDNYGESVLTTVLHEHADGLDTTDEGLKEIVTFLLQSGAHPSPASANYVPYHQILTLIIKEFKDNDKDYTLLKLCLSKGPDLEAREHDEGETALYTAIELEDPNLVKILLEAGANPNTIVREETALIYALNSISDNEIKLEIVKLFVNHPLTDFNIEGFMGKTALDWAIEKGPPQTVQLIQQAINARNHAQQHSATQQPYRPSSPSSSNAGSSSHGKRKREEDENDDDDNSSSHSSSHSSRKRSRQE